MRRAPPVIQISFVLVGLLLAAAAPGIITGYFELNKAESALAAKDYSAASAAFESAARRMFWRSDLWDRAGQAALLAGQPAETLRLLEGRKHLSLPGQLALASAYFQMDDPGAALNIYRSILIEFGGSAQVYSGLAAVYRIYEDRTSEQEALQEQLDYSPEDASVHYRLGLLLTLSDPASALDHLLSASKLDPEFDPVLQTLRTSLNLAALEPDASRRFVTIGRGLGLVAEWPLAAEAFHQAVRSDDGNAEAWAWLGEAKQHLGQDGSEELDQALSRGPQSVIVHALRGLHWKRVGNYQEALIEYRSAAGLEPDNPAWKTALGETYARLGDLVSALTVYQSAVELAPGDATTWRLLATFCAEYNVQIQEVGLPAARKAVELAPNDALALDVLGWNQLGAELYYSAEQTLLSALKADPDLPAGHLHLALVYLRTGDRQAAYDHLVRVRELDPGGTFGNLAEQILNQNFP